MFMGNVFFEREDTEVFIADRNELFASNERQTDNHTLMLDMPHLNISVVYLPLQRCLKKYFLVWLSFFVDLCSQKADKGTELQFLCTQGFFQGGRVEDHRLMFTRYLHSPQLYIQAILFLYKLN